MRTQGPCLPRPSTYADAMTPALIAEAILYPPAGPTPFSSRIAADCTA